MCSLAPGTSAGGVVASGVRSPARIAAIAAAAGIFGLYGPTSLEIVSLWEESASSSHGPFAVLVCLWLLWRNRDRIASEAARPTPKGLFLILAAGLAWLAGNFAGASVVSQFALVGMVYGALWSVLGDRVFRSMMGPLSFLLFAIPLGPSLVPILMEWTASSVVAGLRFSGIPVWQEGTNFVIPTGQWSVIEWCSGVRYLSVSTFAGSVFAYLTFTSWRKRAVFVAISVVLPIVANWVRAYTIVVVAHLSSNKYGVVVGHLTLGWIIFGIAVFAIFSVGARWRDPSPAHVATEGTRPDEVSVSRVAAALLLVLVCVVPWRLVSMNESDGNDPRAFPSKAELESFLTGCSQVAGKLPIAPKYANAVTRIEGEYDCGGTRIGVLIAWYRNQVKGKELNAYENRLLVSDRWWTKPPARADQPVDGGVACTVLEQEFQLGERRVMTRRLYWVAGWTTTHDIVAKLLLGLARVMGRGDDSAIILWTQTFERSTDPKLADSLAKFAEPRLQVLFGTLEGFRSGHSAPR